MYAHVCVCVNEEAFEQWIWVQGLCLQYLQQLLTHGKHLMLIELLRFF